MKTGLNIPLKMAIVQSRRTQKTLARLARIETPRLSNIIHGKLVATERERRRLSELLGKPESELFPTTSTEATL